MFRNNFLTYLKTNKGWNFIKNYLKILPKRVNIKRLYILIAFILILSGILSGCTSSDFDNYKSQIINNPDFCKTLGEKADLCFIYASLELGKIDLCEKIISEELKIECYEELAQTVLNPEKCKDLADPKRNDFSARNKCYENIAVQTNNESLCYFLGQSEQECDDLRKYVKIYGDEREAENIDEVVAQCKEESVLSKNYCFAEIAKEKKDVLVCDEKIIKKSEYPDFTPFCYDWVAKAKMDISLCKHIDCVAYVAVNTGNINLCFEIENEKYSVESEDVAVSWKDKLANKGLLNITEEKNKCIFQFSNTFTDASICKEITDSRLTTECVMNVISRTSDIKQCEFIPVSIQVDDHYLFSLGDSVNIEELSLGIKKLKLVPGMFLVPDSINKATLESKKGDEYIWKVVTENPDVWWEIHYILGREEVFFFGPLGASTLNPTFSSYLKAKMTTEDPFKIDISFIGGFLDCESITISEDGSKQLRNCQIPNLFNVAENDLLDCYTLVTVGHNADVQCRNALLKSDYNYIMNNMTEDMRKKTYGNRPIISKDQCISEIKGNAKGAKECLKIYKQKHRNECLYRSAKESGSEEPCKLIKVDNQNMNSCKKFALYIVENFKGYSMSAEYSVTAGLISEQDVLTE